MFSGIIEGIGRVTEATQKSGKLLLGLETVLLFKSVKLGDSVAVNGACLTVSRRKGRTIFFDVVAETLKRTTLGSLKVQDEVNLELPLRWGKRISGHFVLGHIDGIGIVKKVERRKSQASFLIECPKPLKRFIVEKGSIGVDGVSLTVGKTATRSFWVHVIPHTLKHTNFRHFAEATRVNLEVDYIAKLAIS